MSEGSRRDRREVGDATRARIEELADGWDVPADAAGPSDPEDGQKGSEDRPDGGVSDSAEPPGTAGESPRGKRVSRPPPPPHSRSVRPSQPPPPPPGARKARPSQPPPPPPGSRAARPSQPPPPPPGARKKRPSEPPPVNPETEPPEPIAEPTPVGERSYRRRRRPSPALPTPPTMQRSDDDDEETALVPLDAPIPPPVRRPRSSVGSYTASLRIPESLPRRKGVLGDVGYLFAIVRASPKTRRELHRIDGKLDKERQGRQQRLLEAARHAIADDSLKLNAIDAARERLVELEEARSRHAGAVAAADERIESLREGLEEKAKQRTERIATLETEIQSIATALEPLELRHGQARRRADRLYKTLDDLDDQIEDREASLTSVENRGEDRASIEADIAALRAERESVAADEPEIADELDELEPKIANLIASRTDLERRIDRLRKVDTDSELRTAEIITAIRAQKVVDQRAADDRAAERQEALLDLGEALNDFRPEGFGHRLEAIEQHELAIATLERRAFELREMRSGVSRFALFRGALWLLLAGTGIAAALLWAMNR